WPGRVRRSVDPGRNFTCPRRLQGLAVDELLTGLESARALGHEDLCYRGSYGQVPGKMEVWLLTSPAFRELLVFTPAHRQAVCLEPYTCATDVINLQEQGKDAGLLVLAPGNKWEGQVRMELSR